MYLTSVVGLIFGLLLGGVGEAFAQTAKAITGNVSDEKGEPIISGTVKLKDTNTQGRRIKIIRIKTATFQIVRH